MAQKRIGTEELRSLVYDVLSPAGDASARQVADALVDAEVRGQPRFGLSLVADAPAGSPAELKAYLALAESDVNVRGAVITVQARGKFGPTAVGAILDQARTVAADHGICLVQLVDIGKFGRLAPVVRAVAERGAIGLLGMTSRSFVAPFGGTLPALGTNPVAAGIPTRGEPLVVDTATSAITVARWHDAQEGLSALPEGALVDAEGRPTSSVADGVAISPRGGILGTSVGLLVEVLASAVTGLVSTPDARERSGFLLVIEPQHNLADIGQAIADKVADAGGRVPGVRAKWPAEVAVSESDHAALVVLADLAKKGKD